MSTYHESSNGFTVACAPGSGQLNTARTPRVVTRDCRFADTAAAGAGVAGILSGPVSIHRVHRGMLHGTIRWAWLLAHNLMMNGSYALEVTLSGAASARKPRSAPDAGM